MAAYTATANVSEACKAAGVGRTTHYRWLGEDEAYEKAFFEAKDAAIHVLEEEALRRAIDGWDEPVYQGGELVGTKRKYSDTLLIWMGKAMAPKRHRDRTEISGEGGGPIQVGVGSSDWFDAMAKKYGGKSDPGSDDQPQQGV